MFRIVSVILAASLAHVAMAAPLKPTNLKFMCMTGQPTTSFGAYTEGDTVKVIMLHHNGVDYMPIHSGPITPNDIEMLRQRGELLKKLGQRLEVTFPLKECDFFSDGIISCRRGNTFELNGLKIRAFALNTSLNLTSFQDYEFIKREVMLTLDINDKLQHIQMPYEPAECEFEISVPGSQK